MVGDPINLTVGDGLKVARGRWPYAVVDQSQFTEQSRRIPLWPLEMQ